MFDVWMCSDFGRFDALLIEQERLQFFLGKLPQVAIDRIEI